MIEQKWVEVPDGKFEEMVFASDVYAAVIFWHKWQKIKNLQRDVIISMQKLSQQPLNLFLVDVDLEDHAAWATNYSLNSYPATVVFLRGQLVVSREAKKRETTIRILN